MDLEKLLYFSTAATSSFTKLLKPRPEVLKRILLVKLDEIGDMVYLLPCIEAFRKWYPESEITVYCKPVSKILVTQTNAVNQVVHDTKALSGKYDLQVDFRGNWQTMLRGLFFGSSLYLDRGSVRLRNKIAGGQTHELITNQNILSFIQPDDFSWEPVKLNTSKTDEEAVEKLLGELAVRKYAVVHCGAREASRRWSKQRFAEIIDWMYSEYQLHSLLIGAPNEVEVAEEVSQLTKYAFNVAGKTSLLELAVLLQKSELFLGNESGPLHFAIVEQKPLVALFGPGVENVFYPLYDKQQVIHHTEISNPLERMDAISVEEVQTAIKDVYSES